ncbi:unnamed protein product [Merluccius merluccius]
MSSWQEAAAFIDRESLFAPAGGGGPWTRIQGQFHGSRVGAGGGAGTGPRSGPRAGLPRVLPPPARTALIGWESPEGEEGGSKHKLGLGHLVQRLLPRRPLVEQDVVLHHQANVPQGTNHMVTVFIGNLDVEVDLPEGGHSSWALQILHCRELTLLPAPRVKYSNNFCQCVQRFRVGILPLRPPSYSSPSST